MPKLADLPISRVPPSGRAATAGPSRSIVREMEQAARGEEYTREAVGRGIQQIGAGIEAIGEKLHRQLVGDQRLTAGIEYETGLQKFFVDVDNTKHVKDGIPQWDKILEQGNIRHKELIEGISKNLVPEAKEAFLLYAQERKLNFDKTLYGKIQGIRDNYINEIFPLSMMRFARSGDTEAANKFLNQLKKYYFPKSQWQELDKAFDKNVVLGAIGNRLPEAHIERLIKESDSLTQEEKTSLRSQAKTAKARRMATSKAQYNAYAEATEQIYLVKLRKMELTENEIMVSNLDVDKKQEWLGYVDKQADEILKGEDIIVNQEEKRRLGDLIIELWRDRITPDALLKEIRNARWPSDKSSAKIDDKTFDTLVSKSRTELKAVQNESISDMIRDVSYELGVVEQSTMQIMLAMIEDKDDRQRVQNDNQSKAARVNLFEEMIYDFLKENPKAQRDEFEKFKRDTFPHIRKWEPGMPMPHVIDAGKAAVIAIKEIAAQAEIAELLKPKVVKSIDDIPMPKDKREFINKLRELEKIDPKISAEYYNKYLDKFW